MLFAFRDAGKVFRNLCEKMVISLQILKSFSCKCTPKNKYIFQPYLICVSLVRRFNNFFVNALNGDTSVSFKRACSTDWAISGLTSEIGRVPVLFTVYGRSYFYTLFVNLEIIIKFLVKRDTKLINWFSYPGLMKNLKFFYSFDMIG